MRRRILFLLPVILIGCARTPDLPSSPDCVATSPITVLLSVERPRGEASTLVVHGAPERAGYTQVAVNTVGVPLFSAVQEKRRFRVQERATYRGPDPQWLLWGLHWWRADGVGSECLAEAGYRGRWREGRREILRGDAVYWRGNVTEPYRFELPRQGLGVQVREREANDQ